MPTTEKICISCNRPTEQLLRNAKLRPVFREEIELMSELIGKALMRCPRDGILWRSGHDYYVLGKKVFRLCGGSISQPPALRIVDAQLWEILQRSPSRLPAALRRPCEAQLERLRAANMRRLVSLEEEAVTFLRTTRAAFPDLPLVVSWSGGKDSTVASLLAQRAFPEERIVHVFADTTIELPSTYAYLTEFRRAYPTLPFVIGVPSRDFYELCREIGPPSRIQRWCCTTHKASPLADILGAIGGDKEVLVASGLRRTESRRRKDYSKIIHQGKIGRQKLLNPIADWSDFDVWAYTLVQGLPVNEAYKYGLDRVGCAFCPDSRDWRDMIGFAKFRSYFSSWFKHLIDIFSQAQVENPEQYVYSGAWKSRRGGGIGKVGLPRAQVYDVITAPCQEGECATGYELSTTFSFSMLGELLKPFGKVYRLPSIAEMGYFEVEGPYGAFSVKAIPIWKRLRVVFEDERVRRRLEGTIRLQLRKLQACVGCGACATLCPQGAIIQVGEKYRIIEDKCHHCLQCVRRVKAGCQAAHSVNRKMSIYV